LHILISLKLLHCHAHYFDTREIVPIHIQTRARKIFNAQSKKVRKISFLNRRIWKMSFPHETRIVLFNPNLTKKFDKVHQLL